MCDDPSENPFCTRRIRPGAIPFLFPDGQDVETLVDRLRTHGWCGQIVGPHGSGKSALLATLIPAIERAGRHVTLVELHDGQRRLPLRLGGRHRLREPAVLVIDGYEQLSRWNRWRLRRLCRRNNWGLVVTSHASVGLPPLWQTAVTSELAEAVVDTLLAGQSSPLSEQDLADCLSRHQGDLREMLFDLYDRHEALRSKSRSH
jgi:hypothetical protein